MRLSVASVAVAASNRMTLLTNSPNSRSRKRHSATLISPSLSSERRTGLTSNSLFTVQIMGALLRPALSKGATRLVFRRVQDPPPLLSLYMKFVQMFPKVGGGARQHSSSLALIHSFISSFAHVEISLPFSANDARTVT